MYKRPAYRYSRIVHHPLNLARSPLFIHTIYHVMVLVIEKYRSYNLFQFTGLRFNPQLIYWSDRTTFSSQSRFWTFLSGCFGLIEHWQRILQLGELEVEFSMSHLPWASKHLQSNQSKSWCDRTYSETRISPPIPGISTSITWVSPPITHIHSPFNFIHSHFKRKQQLLHGISTI